jgi:phosphoserine phosphatase RsbU/P
LTDRAESTAPPGPASGTASRVRVLLVDDQLIVGEAVRRILAQENDVDFLHCVDPTTAMEVANRFQPTVILQDLVMPQIDGLAMLRFYRVNPAVQDIPIIVLSTKEEPKVKAEAFMLGASDYLVKLPDPIELIARLRHHSRGYIALLERNEAYAALKRSEERLADELSQAAQYVTSLLPERLNGEIATDWTFIPSVELGGDAFGYYWLDADRFVMYLLDVCGHGVKAALLSISAMDVLRNQTLRATDFSSPAQVLEGLNEAFQMERHNGLYFTMFYAVYDRRTRQIAYANAGHPPAILMAGESADTAVPVKLAKPGMIIGGFPSMKFAEEVRSLPAFSRLYFFSDGVYEIERPDGTMLGLPALVDLLSNAGRRGGGTLADTVRSLHEVRGTERFEDDVSIVEVTFSGRHSAAPVPRPQ